MNKKQIFIFALLAVLIFALGAQLATAQPVEVRIGNTVIHFFPLIFSTKAADAPSGVLYVFSSTVTTDGDAGGRPGMGDICFTEDPNSHFWVANPEVGGDWEDHDLNCYSWLENDILYNGTIIYETARALGGMHCNQIRPVACCKQMP
jgi:hypothetical protein